MLEAHHEEEESDAADGPHDRQGREDGAEAAYEIPRSDRSSPQTDSEP